MPDHERVEVPSDDVAMGASDPAIGDRGAGQSRRTFWDTLAAREVLIQSGIAVVAHAIF